ncbi:hypothetical protein MASR1M45_01680 [Candidatus Kapaibacterium sp.]
MNFIFHICIMLPLLYANLFSQLNPDYDQDLAKKLNADDLGMKSYVFVILKTGNITNPTKELRDSLFKGHMSNMKKLADEGLLVTAGPFNKNDKNYRGLFILNVDNLEKAKEIVDTDPAVQGKLLDTELYLWYGSAAIQELNKIHNKIQKKGF